MTASTTSIFQLQSACQAVLLIHKNLEIKIFSYLLADQKIATRNLRDMSIEKQNLRRKNYDCLQKHVKLGKHEKKQLLERGLKEGTRNMEVLRSVCKKWNTLIHSNKEFHFYLIFTRAKRFIAEQLLFLQSDRPNVFYDVLYLEALVDPEGVALTLSHFPKGWISDWKLQNLVKDCLSKNKLASGKALAQAIPNLSEKMVSFCEIARIDREFIQKTRALLYQLGESESSSLLAELAVIEALNDNFDEALILAEESKNYQDRTYKKIAIAAAQHRPDVVKKWTALIKNSETLALTMFEIAIIESNPTHASEWLSKLEKNNSLHVKNYLKIAKLDKSLGYDKAKHCISLLSPETYTVELLIELAELDEKPNFAEAKRVASLSPVASYPDDPEIDSYFGRDGQYCAIAQAEAKYDTEAALVTAQNISDHQLKTRIINDIERARVNKMHNGDIKAAQIAAIQFGSTEQEIAYNLLKIACEGSRPDLTETKAFIYDGMSNAVEKVVVSCEIAKAVLEIPLDHYKLRKDNLSSLYAASERNKRVELRKKLIPKGYLPIDDLSRTWDK